MQVNYGESVKLVGSGSALGDWDVSAAPEMRWTDGDVWVAELELPAEEDVHFKVGHSRRRRCPQLLMSICIAEKQGKVPVCPHCQWAE